EDRQVTTFEGADNDTSLESPLAWSPDSRRIAYVQQAEDKWIYYAPWSLAVVDVDSGKVTRPLGTDGFHTKPTFTPDGKALLVLIEESRVTHLSRVDLDSGAVTPLTSGRRFDSAYASAPNGHIAVLGSDDQHPYRIEAVEPAGLRLLADNNEWLKNRRLATVEDIRFESADGTSIDGFLM